MHNISKNRDYFMETTGTTSEKIGGNCSLDLVALILVLQGFSF